MVKQTDQALPGTLIAVSRIVVPQPQRVVYAVKGIVPGEGEFARLAFHRGHCESIFFRDHRPSTGRNRPTASARRCCCQSARAATTLVPPATTAKTRNIVCHP